MLDSEFPVSTKTPCQCNDDNQQSSLSILIKRIRHLPVGQYVCDDQAIRLCVYYSSVCVNSLYFQYVQTCLPRKRSPLVQISRNHWLDVKANKIIRLTSSIFTWSITSHLRASLDHVITVRDSNSHYLPPRETGRKSADLELIRVN